MPGKNKSGLGSGSNDPSTTTQDSHAAAFLASTLFLIAPIALLLISGREHPTPIEDYQRAVREAAQPNASQVSHSLISVGFGKPVTVVTWTRQDRVSDYQAKTAPPDGRPRAETVLPRLCQIAWL